MYRLDPDNLEEIAAVVSASAVMGAGPAALLAIVSRDQRLSRSLVRGATAYLVNEYVLKRLFGSMQPRRAHRVFDSRGRSLSPRGFPSSHSFSAGVALGAADSAFEVAAMSVIAATVGWSRLRLRAHTPADVVAGVGLGLALCRGLRRLGRNRRTGRTSSLW